MMAGSRQQSRVCRVCRADRGQQQLLSMQQSSSRVQVRTTQHSSHRQQPRRGACKRAYLLLTETISKYVPTTYYILCTRILHTIVLPYVVSSPGIRSSSRYKPLIGNDYDWHNIQAATTALSSKLKITRSVRVSLSSFLYSAILFVFR